MLEGLQVPAVAFCIEGPAAIAAARVFLRLQGSMGRLFKLFLLVLIDFSVVFIFFFLSLSFSQPSGYWGSWDCLHNALCTDIQ